MIDKNKANARQNRYDKENTFRVALKFNNETDSDIKSWLDLIKVFNIIPIQGYIKRLIRTDIANHQKSGIDIKEYFKKEQEKFEKMKNEKHR